MENEAVSKVIGAQIEGLSLILSGNSSSHLEVARDGSWTLYRTKPDWEKEL